MRHRLTTTAAALGGMLGALTYGDMPSNLPCSASHARRTMHKNLQPMSRSGAVDRRVNEGASP